MARSSHFNKRNAQLDPAGALLPEDVQDDFPADMYGLGKTRSKVRVLNYTTLQRSLEDIF